MALDTQIDAAARGDARPVVGDVFDRFLDTVIDATSAQWATFTVDVITHARGAGLSRADLLELLAALGITDPAAEPKAVAS
jgi:hypothetical protein